MGFLFINPSAIASISLLLAEDNLCGHGLQIHARGGVKYSELNLNCWLKHHVSASRGKEQQRNINEKI